MSCIIFTRSTGADIPTQPQSLNQCARPSLSPPLTGCGVPRWKPSKALCADLGHSPPPPLSSMLPLPLPALLLRLGRSVGVSYVCLCAGGGGKKGRESRWSEGRRWLSFQSRAGRKQQQYSLDSLPPAA